ncbi:hypothetical protein E2C01_012525 [Portunus trituberculatus]|uniref:Uncharacterized protein n=1 Tax=Portunus trituberculatus TaxID=210409 RepID=A0A5B7DEU1_PORTR|nr:hypothetical protein [Portunus trituberculatus]
MTPCAEGTGEVLGTTGVGGAGPVTREWRGTSSGTGSYDTHPHTSGTSHHPTLAMALQQHPRPAAFTTPCSVLTGLPAPRQTLTVICCTSNMDFPEHTLPNKGLRDAVRYYGKEIPPEHY